MISNKYSVRSVTLLKKSARPEYHELSDIFHNKCSFCEKYFKRNIIFDSLNERFSTNGTFCNFCIRNNFNTKISKNVLIFSFEPIIDEFYKRIYLKNMWAAEVQDYIISHQEAGLLNPVFVYDEETMLWFIDFARVGNRENEASLASINQSIMNILACFNLKLYFPNLLTGKLYKKYEVAIDKFMKTRQRNKKNSIFSPTLKDCWS